MEAEKIITGENNEGLRKCLAKLEEANAQPTVSEVEM
jgi:hypothetical protein